MEINKSMFVAIVSKLYQYYTINNLDRHRKCLLGQFHILFDSTKVTMIIKIIPFAADKICTLGTATLRWRLHGFLASRVM